MGTWWGHRLIGVSIGWLILAACSDGPTSRDTSDGAGADGEVADTADVGDTSPPEDVMVEVDGDEADVSDVVEPDTDTSGEHPDVADDGEGEVRAPVCGDGIVAAGEACDDGDLDDLDGCDRACAVTRSVRAPNSGEVVINELMINPYATPDPRGEWVELVSVSSEELNLSSCRLIDEGTDEVGLAREGGLAIDAGAILLVVSEGGPEADWIYSTMLLDDVADEVVLVCGEVVVDRVAWTPYAWPVIGGRALSLDPSRRAAADNDVVEAWCAATSLGRHGERGTPGAPNPTCPHLDREIDRCRLLGEAEVTGFAGAPVRFEVAVEELGLTDLTSGVDTSPDLVVEVGSGSVLADVSDASSFAWARARPRAGYQAPIGSHADVWEGEVTEAAAGTRRVMARASRDGGASWRYCDRDGSDDGVALEDLARLTVAASPCQGVTCDDPPAASCADDGVQLLGYAALGECTPIDQARWACDYRTQAVDCGLLGRSCETRAGGAVCGTVPRTPVMGELYVSELMVRATAEQGQWLEIASLADEPLLLTGCELQVDSTTTALSWSLEAPTVIGPHGILVVGASDVYEDNGGAAVARAWADALVLPDAGAVSLSCGELLDVVVWDATWPGVSGPAGASAALSPLRRGPADNDTEEAWCRAATSFGAGDRGTPGAPNPACPGDIIPVESCSIGGAATVSPPAGTEATASVRVIARTWTSKTLKTDPNAKLVVEVGVAPRGAGPASITRWSGSAPDVVWTASGAGVDPAEDRYLASYLAPAPGAWDLYARATADGGNSWSVCDRNGVVAGASVGEPITLSPVASACWPDPCGAPPVSYCRPVASGAPTEIVAAAGAAACTLDARGGAVCDWEEEVVDDCALYGAECSEAASGAGCTGFPRAPRPGEVVLSELVIAPGGSELGEWIELQSASDDAIDLRGCELRSGRGAETERWGFGEPLAELLYVIAPGRAITVARSATGSVNGGAQPVMVYSGVSLDNAADWLELVCPADGALIDRVAWDIADGWVIPYQTSLQLSGATLTAAANDAPEAFCAPGVTSPREANRVCPGDGVLDGCRVQKTFGGTITAGVAFEVGVVVSDPGVSDLRAGVDPAIGMLVDVGIGPRAENPTTSLRWRWSELDPDASWDDRASGPRGWDRWSGAVVADAIGALSIVGRVSLDDGRSWVYCDDLGFTEASDGIALTGLAGLCAPSPCTTPPAATCAGTTLTGYSPSGVCSAEVTASCDYPSETFSCAAYGGCNAAAAGCTSGPPRPAVKGDVVISEIMRDSTLPAPDLGEWVELRNVSTTAFDLRGCELVTGAGVRTVIARGVPDVVSGGAHAVFAHGDDPADNGGIPTTLGKPRSLGLITLGNGGDSLALVCGGVETDRVAWRADWPGRTGYAMQLDRGRLDADQNDLRSSWCDAIPGYGLFGNKGSPGSLNPTCP